MLLIIILALFFIFGPLVSAQEANHSAYFHQGILKLPKVNIMPHGETFAVILRQLDQQFIFELANVDVTSPTRSAASWYDPQRGQLYIATVVVGSETYEAELQLVTPVTLPPRYQLTHYALINNNIDDNQKIVATVETDPVPVGGDAADDPAIWVHPYDPSLSTIIGTQKLGALVVYDLSGREIQYLAEGRMNNVDLREDFNLNQQFITLVAASNRDNNSIALYTVNPNSRHLEPIAARIIKVDLAEEIYGLCMYHSALSGQYYVFVNDKSGTIEQWHLLATPTAQVDASLVRRFHVASQPEGCVADDALGYLYLGEEHVGIWKFQAEPEASTQPLALVDSTDAQGHITADVEGLTLYETSATGGYLLASSQGNHSFTVYQRQADNAYLGRFRIESNQELAIDSVEDTDGIAATPLSLGPAFPYGVFVAQDGRNTDPDEKQNFKLVPWESIAQALRLP